MRRVTYTLGTLYAILAIGLFRCALISYQARSVGYTCFFAAASIGAALAIVHVSWLRDEYRAVLVQLDRTRHPIRITTVQDAQVAELLAPACCETWWTTAGTEHDPEHCTRKDQTT